MALTDTDWIVVDRGGSPKKCAAKDIQTNTKAGDYLCINRGGNTRKLDVANVDSLADSDWVLVGKGTTAYKATGAEVKGFFGGSPGWTDVAINAVDSLIDEGIERISGGNNILCGTNPLPESGCLIYSTDHGTTWRRHATAGSQHNDGWEDTFFADGVFMACKTQMGRPQGEIIWSTNANNWNYPTVSLPINGSWTGITYSPDFSGRWLCIGTAGTSGRVCVYSDDNGLSWTQGGTPSGNPLWDKCAYGNGRFATVGPSTSSGVDNFLYSFDGGVSWRTGNNPNKSHYWTDVKFGNGVFVAIGYQLSGVGIGVYSTDAANWTRITNWAGVADPDGRTRGVGFGKGKFCVVGECCTYTSEDGVNWEKSASGSVPNTQEWYCVAYSGKRFVAGSIDSGQPQAMWSENGL